jgi:hypothetical protein
MRQPGIVTALTGFLFLAACDAGTVDQERMLDPVSPRNVALDATSAVLKRHNEILADVRSPGKQHNAYLASVKLEMERTRFAKGGRKLRGREVCDIIAAVAVASGKPELARHARGPKGLEPKVCKNGDRTILPKLSTASLESWQSRESANSPNYATRFLYAGLNSADEEVSAYAHVFDAFDDSLAALVASPWHDSLGNQPTMASDTLLLASIQQQVSTAFAGVTSVSSLQSTMASVAASYGNCGECIELVAPLTAFAVESGQYWEEELDDWKDDQCEGGGEGLALFRGIAAIADGCPPSEVNFLRRELGWKDVAEADVLGAIGMSKDDLRGFINYMNSAYWEKKAYDELKSGGNWLPSMIRMEAPPGATRKVIAKFGGILLRRMHIAGAVLGAGTTSAYAAANQ